MTDSTPVTTIYRCHKTDDPFVRLLRELARDKRLSFKARGIMALVLSNKDEWQVHQTWLQDQGTEGREAIASGMQELERFGYAIHIEVRDKTGKIETAYWTFYDKPRPESERTNKTRWLKHGLPANGNPSHGLPAKGNQAAKKIEEREDVSTEEQEDPPKTPKASASPSLVGHSPSHHCQYAKRVVACIGRQAETGWAPNEIRAWKNLYKEYRITEEALVAVEVYYMANRKKPSNICRKGVLALINNFPGEVDRAIAWKDAQSGRNRNKSHEQKNDYYDQTF